MIQEIVYLAVKVLMEYFIPVCPSPSLIRLVKFMMCFTDQRIKLGEPKFE